MRHGCLGLWQHRLMVGVHGRRVLLVATEKGKGGDQGPSFPVKGMAPGT